MSDRYNGWTNYETWNVALWIGNEEGPYRYWRAQTQECWDNARADGTFTRKERAALDLADQLKTEFEEGNPLADQASSYSDLLNSAISSVNWYEIANNWLEDVETEGEEPEEEDDTEGEG